MCKLEYIIFMEGYKSDALYQMQINIKYDPEYTEEKEIQKFVNLVSISHFRQQKLYVRIMIKYICKARA